MRKLLHALALVLGFASAVQAQYCVTNLHNGTCNANFVTTASAFSLNPGGITVTRQVCTPGGTPYFDYATTPGPNQKGTVVQGGNYTMQVTLPAVTIGPGGGLPRGLAAWIDWDNDGTLAASEYIQGTAPTTGNVFTITFNVPAAQNIGDVRMRIRNRVAVGGGGGGNANFAAGDACLSIASVPLGGGGAQGSNGSTTDFTLEVIAPTACSGQPNITAIRASNTSLCISDSAIFTFTTVAQESGITYQWETAPGNGTTFTPVAGATKVRFGISALSLTDSVQVRVIATCTNGGQTTTSNVIKVKRRPFTQCYCNTNLHSAQCQANSLIGNVSITGTTLNNTVSACGSGNSAYYVFQPTTSTTATLVKSGTYTINVASVANMSISLWIDYNQNGIFEDTEYTQVSAGTSAANPGGTASFNVPSTALSGLTGMRVRTRGIGGGGGGPAPNGPNNACTTFGQGSITHDYFVSIDAPVACSGTPSTSSLSATATVICPNDSAIVTLTAPPITTGNSISWFIGPDRTLLFPAPGINGNRLSVLGNSFFDSVFVQAEITCNASGLSTRTSLIKISARPFTQCYCTANLHNAGCQAGGFISNVNLINSGLNNSVTSCPPPTGGGPGGGFSNPYFNFADSSRITGFVYTGSAQPIAVTLPGDLSLSVWIDYDQDGQYDGNEYTSLTTNSGAAGTTINGIINIPANAIPGRTGMRVRARGTGANNGQNDACSTFGQGSSTHEYRITILQANPCTGRPNAGMLSAADTTLCLTDSVLVAPGITQTTSGLTYNWQIQRFGGGFTTVSTNSAFRASGALFGTDTVYSIRLELTCTASGLTYTTNAVRFFKEKFYNCYCSNAIVLNACNPGQIISTIEMPAANLNINNISCPPNAAPGYYTWPQAAGNVATVQVGGTYNLNITTLASQTASVWLDANHNGDFEATEHTQIATTTAPTAAGTPTTVQLVVPTTATIGLTRMRIRTRNFGGGGPAPNGAANACTVFGSGTTHDVFVQIIPAVTCTSVPSPLRVQSTMRGICQQDSNQVVVINLSNAIVGSGYTYQWQRATTLGQWSDITVNGNQATLGQNWRSVGDSTWFRVKLTCGAASQTVISDSIKLFRKKFNECYCATALQNNNCSNQQQVQRFAIANGNFNWASVACVPNAFAYRVLADTGRYVALLSQGGSYTVNAQAVAQAGGGGGQAALAFWIDYNQNGVFEATEYNSVSQNIPQGTPIAAYTLNVPATATLGTTRMRIRLRVIGNGATNGPNDACTSFNSGYTLDATAQIVQTTAVASNLASTLAYKVYPNPVANELQVENLLGQAADLMVINTSGQLVQQHKLDGSLMQSISVANLPAGIYSVRMNTAQGSYTYRIVKQ